MMLSSWASDRSAVSYQTRRQMRPIGWLRRRDRGHRRRLDELCRMGVRPGNTDRLQRVFLIKRIGDLGRLPAASTRPSRMRVLSPRRCRQRRSRRLARRKGRGPFVGSWDACWRRPTTGVGRWAAWQARAWSPNQAMWRHRAPCPARRETRSDRRRAACRSQVSLVSV